MSQTASMTSSNPKILPNMKPKNVEDIPASAIKMPAAGTACPLKVMMIRKTTTA